MDSANQDYVLAGGKDTSNAVEGVTVPPNSPIAFNGIKRGHKCCGGCCDVRRATIIVNIISLVLGGLGLIAFLSLTSMSNNSGQFDDDEVAAAFEEMEGYSAGVRLAIGLTCAKMVLNALGIYGGYSYTLWAIGASAFAYALDFLMSLIHFDIASLILSGGFLYPHVYLIMEIRNGIMSRETYEQEKFSCCCV